MVIKVFVNVRYVIVVIKRYRMISDELKMYVPGGKVAIFGREEGCLLYFMLINCKNVV
jgi:hypothetical protein